MNKKTTKPTKPQGKSPRSFRVRAKVALVTRRWSIKKLAGEIERPRETVSRAINQEGRFPLVRKQVEEALGL